MVNRYITTELRELISSRAKFSCEYCLIAEEDTFFGCQIEHITSLKHGGSSELGNLAYSCVFCNRYKGSDIASISSGTGELVRFYNPRLDLWKENFALDEGLILPLSDVGEVTIRILRFNDEERVMEREALIKRRRYPTFDL